jgi:hypothetical protein
MITARDKLKCVERELVYRHRVYDRLVERGKMTKRQSQHEIELMEAIAADYRTVVKAEADAELPL